jgi:hypothetical protein
MERGRDVKREAARRHGTWKQRDATGVPGSASNFSNLSSLSLPTFCHFLIVNKTPLARTLLSGCLKYKVMSPKPQVCSGHSNLAFLAVSRRDCQQ